MWLKIAGWSSVAVAVLHVIIVFAGAPSYRYFGAGEDMARPAEAGSLVPAALTLFIATVFAVFALYAFSGAGSIRRLPLLRTGLVVIGLICTVRGLGLILQLLQGTILRDLVFSLVSLTIGIAYLWGTLKAWPGLRPQRHLLPMIVLIAANAVSAQPAADVPRVEFTQYQTANGLRVVLAPDKSAPTVAVSITYDLGSRNERPGQTGVANLLHAMSLRDLQSRCKEVAHPGCGEERGVPRLQQSGAHQLLSDRTRRSMGACPFVARRSDAHSEH